MFKREDFIQLFSCNKFTNNDDDDDDVITNTDEISETNTHNLIDSIINTKLMTNVVIFDSYSFLLSQMDYLKYKVYKIVCDKFISFVNENIDVLTHDWSQEEPLCCLIIKQKNEKIIDITNDENDEYKTPLIQRINLNYSYFINNIVKVNKLKVYSKDNVLLDILDITKFEDSYGNTYDDYV